jgi:hypothetical protein
LPDFSDRLLRLTGSEGGAAERVVMVTVEQTHPRLRFNSSADCVRDAALSSTPVSNDIQPKPGISCRCTVFCTASRTQQNLRVGMAGAGSLNTRTTPMPDLDKMPQRP